MAVHSIRVPDELHQTVKRRAKAQGVSMNQYYLYAAATTVAREEAEEAFRRIAGRGSDQDLKRILDAVPSRDPLPGDELPDDLRRDLDRLYGEKAGTST